MSLNPLTIAKGLKHGWVVVSDMTFTSCCASVQWSVVVGLTAIFLFCFTYGVAGDKNSKTTITDLAHCQRTLINHALRVYKPFGHAAVGECLFNVRERSWVGHLFIVFQDERVRQRRIILYPLSSVASRYFPHITVTDVTTTYRGFPARMVYLKHDL